MTLIPTVSGTLSGASPTEKRKESMTDHDWQPLPGSQTLEYQTRNGRTRLRNRPGTLNRQAAGTSWKAPQRPPTAPTLTPTRTPNPGTDAAQDRKSTRL